MSKILFVRGLILSKYLFTYKKIRFYLKELRKTLISGADILSNSYKNKIIQALTNISEGFDMGLFMHKAGKRKAKKIEVETSEIEIGDV